MLLTRRLQLALLLSVPLATGTSAGEQSVARVLDAVVSIEATIPDTARTAAALGTERFGSGVLIDAGGLVATIGYLILEATTVTVVDRHDRRRDAALVGYDSSTGFGLVRVREPGEALPLAMGDSSELGAGTPVLIASYGGSQAIRPAVVASRREFAGYWEYLLQDAVFTTPPHPAFGGAALLDARGRLLGIGSLAVPDARPGQDLPGNMFVPINALKAVLGDMLTAGRSSLPPTPWLGVLTHEVRGQLVVAHVSSGGPAELAGVETGDVIVAVNGQAVESMADFYRKVWAMGSAGARIPLTLSSNHRQRRVEVASIDRYHWLRLAPLDR